VDLIHIVIVLIIVGVLLWLEEAYIPMAAPFKVIIRVVVIVAVCIWLLNITGILDAGRPIRLHSQVNQYELA